VFPSDPLFRPLPDAPVLNEFPLPQIEFGLFGKRFRQSLTLLMLVATATITTIQRIKPAIPTKPRTMPAVAMPLPPCRPALSLICLRATKPKITARIAPSPNTQTMPSTSAAMEKPFVVWPEGR
jgi:hypothetical protein